MGEYLVEQEIFQINNLVEALGMDIARSEVQIFNVFFHGFPKKKYSRLERESGQKIAKILGSEHKSGQIFGTPTDDSPDKKFASTRFGIIPLRGLSGVLSQCAGLITLH